MKIFQIWYHEYMVLKPSDKLYTFESQEIANQFVAHMRENWNSGTVSAAKLLSKEEVLAIADSPKGAEVKSEILNLLSKCDY